MTIQKDEEWREIVNHPGYDISNLGRVRSWWNTGRCPRITTSYKILRPCKGIPYLFVHMKNAKRIKTSRYIHHLVLEAFIEQRPDGAVSRHLNGNATDNRSSNLVWGTQAENIQDKIRHGTHGRGEKSVSAKITQAQVDEIRRRLEAGETQKNLALEFGISRPNVSLIKNRKTWFL